MSLERIAIALVLATLTLSTRSVVAAERVSPTGTTASRAQALLDSAARDDKYAFLLFYKSDDATAQAMLKTVRGELAGRQDEAVFGTVSLASPAEQAVATRFDITRAPMPLLLAVAPNGAVTGIFSKKITAANIDDCFVTPAMTRCMKALQAGKIVMVCVQPTPKATLPAGVVDLQNDADFKDRIATTTFQAGDEAEAPFLAQAELAPAKIKSTTTILLAPPGVLVGTFPAATTADEFAAALHKAGKCCDDPNCKHNQGAKAGATKQSGTRQAKQGGATRN